MKVSVSHDRAEESLQAKARWFQSLSLKERMAYLVMMTDFILQNNPHIIAAKDRQDHAKYAKRRVRVVERPLGRPGLAA